MRKLILFCFVLVSCQSPGIRQPASMGNRLAPPQSSLNNYLKCSLDKLQDRAVENDICPQLNKWKNSQCEDFIGQLAAHLNIEPNNYFALSAREKRLFRTHHGNAVENWVQINKELEARVKKKVGETSFPQAKSCLSAHLNFIQSTDRAFLSLAEAHLWVRSGLTPPSSAQQRRLKKRDTIEQVLRISRLHGQRQVTESVFKKTSFLPNSIPHNTAYQTINDFQDGDLVLITSQEVLTASLGKITHINSIYDLIGIIKIDKARRQELARVYPKVIPWPEIKKSTYVYYASPQSGLVRTSFYDLEQKVTRMTTLRWYDDTDKGKKFSEKLAEYAAELFSIPSTAGFDYQQSAEVQGSKYGQWSFVYKVVKDKLASENYYDLLAKQSKKTFMADSYSNQVSPFLWSNHFASGSTRQIDEFRVDPHFTPVSEWINFRKTESHKNFDLILETIQSWKEKNYSFNTSLSSQDLSRIQQYNFIQAPSVLGQEFYFEVPQSLSGNPEKSQDLKLLQLLVVNLARDLEAFRRSFQIENRKVPTRAQKKTFLEELRSKEWDLLVKKKENTQVSLISQLVDPTDHPIHHLFRPNQMN